VGVERRLAAVLIADCVGYSRLSQADEEGTRARFQTDLHEIFEARIGEHHGRLVKTMGDGLLVEFHSVVDALRCAIEIQRAKTGQNASIPADRRLEFRIGINLGDVIVEGDDIHGDGVNIAHRLQSLAEPGGVMLSGTAYDHVKTKVEIAYTFLGERLLKNIAEPVRVYCALPEPAVGKAIIARKEPHKSRRRSISAGAALLLCATVVVALWLRQWGAGFGPALPLPAEPSIAVLPFANMSGDPRQEYFADGMTDDLITDLSQVSGLFVIGRNSSFAYKGEAVDIRQVSRELGVRYVLEGSIQRSADHVRINAQLIDATTGGHAWAERYDGSLSDIFALQDKVTRSVADALALRLTGVEYVSQSRRETTVPAAYDAFLRGLEHYRNSTPEGYATAILDFEEATKLDPAYGRVHAAIAMIYIQSVGNGWSGFLGITAREALARARKYLEDAKKHPTATAHQVAAYILLEDARVDDALSEIKEAIALDPGDSSSYALMGFVLTSAGRPSDAIRYIDTAMRLDPHPPAVFMFYRGLAEFDLEQFDAAVSFLEQATRAGPDDQFPFLVLSATYGYLGRKHDALSAIGRYNAIVVKLGGIPVSIQTWTLTWRGVYLWRKVDDERLSKGLRLAGVPEFLDRSEFATHNRLTANEVRSLFFGHRLHGRNFWSGEERAASFATDGALTLSGDWGLLDLSAGPAKGFVQFEGTQLCLRLGVANYCGIMLRNPGGITAMENEFMWATASGGYPFSVFE
jgi:adenylate cyclase